MFKHLFTNWKSTLAGTATIVSAVSGVVNGHFDINTTPAMIMAGVGLLMAKDHDVTGGTKAQDKGTTHPESTNTTKSYSGGD